MRDSLTIGKKTWLSSLIQTEKGGIAPRSPENARLFIANHDDLAGCIIYNEFADRIYIAQCPPWENEADFAPRELLDRDAFEAQCWLERQGVKVAKQTACDAIIAAAYKNTVNPPKDHFESLKWDKKERLGTWLSYYLGSEQPEEYLRAAGTKWLAAAARRIYEPGTKFDYMLLLEGEQGIGKSTTFNELSTFGNETYFTDTSLDIHNKDAVMIVQGKVIVELGELASFKKAEQEEIKTFISRREDEYRPPYARATIKRPRYFVLGGSTNETEYLPDDSGNRRYWPVLCGKIDIEALHNDKDQLWAEAIHLHKSGLPIFPSPEEEPYFVMEQKSRATRDAWFAKIYEWFGPSYLLESLSVDEVFDKLEFKHKEKDPRSRKRIKSSLIQLGWEESRPDGSKRVFTRRR